MKNITIIRKMVMTLAHTLVKQCDNLSIAMKIAWRMVKARKIYTTIAGVTFGNRQKALVKLQNYMKSNAELKTTLVRDCTNAFDKNAIKVMVSVNGFAAYQLGFIPKNIAATIAPIMDKVGEVKVHMYKINNGYGATPIKTANIVLWLPNE